MEEMTLEQKKALALAQARLRLAASPEQKEVSGAEQVAGNPLTRFALGAASPALGAAQMASKVPNLARFLIPGLAPWAALGDVTNPPQLEEMKRAGMGEDAGVDWSGLLGTILSPAVLGAMKLPMSPTVLGRAGQGAAMGASFGAASPVVSEDQYWGPKAGQIATGAAIGGAIPPAIDAVKKAWQVGRNIVDPLLPGGAERGAARILAEAAGSKRAAIEGELAKNAELVQGSMPTAAEAAAPAGSAEFSAMQNIARQHKPTAYADIAKAQELARKAAVQGVGKDKATLQAAEAARSAQAADLYGKAYLQKIYADPELAQMSSNPYFQDALPHAFKLAKANMISPKGDLTKFLHYVKLGLDKELTKVGDTALSGTEKQSVEQLKTRLVDWIATKNPAYDKARAAFAAASKPINEMQVGQELEAALTKPLGEGERVGAFASAMRNAPQTIKRASGKTPYKELDEVLSPENLSTVKNVLADLARKSEADRLASLGRGKAAEIAMPFGLPATGPLHQSYMIFKTVLGRVSKGINEKTLDTMADALQVPSETLKLLQRAPAAQRQQMIDEILSQKFGRGAIAAGVSVLDERAQQPGALYR